jgi:hypothetical protein
MSVLGNKQVTTPSTTAPQTPEEVTEAAHQEREAVELLEDRSPTEIAQAEEEVEDLYNLKNFSL